MRVGMETPHLLKHLNVHSLTRGLVCFAVLASSKGWSSPSSGCPNPRIFDRLPGFTSRAPSEMQHGVGNDEVVLASFVPIFGLRGRRPSSGSMSYGDICSPPRPWADGVAAGIRRMIRTSCSGKHAPQVRRWGRPTMWSDSPHRARSLVNWPIPGAEAARDHRFQLRRAGGTDDRRNPRSVWPKSANFLGDPCGTWVPARTPSTHLEAWARFAELAQMRPELAQTWTALG